MTDDTGRIACMKTQSGDRGNELADIRARAEQWIEGSKPYSAPPLALDVLALLSRIDTLEAAYRAATATCLTCSEARERMHAAEDARLAAEAQVVEWRARRDWQYDKAIGWRNRCVKAEAQVEALTEALERITNLTRSSRDGGDHRIPRIFTIVHEALSRVSRSEPGTSLNDARLEALRLVATVIDGMGDNAPAALVDAHRVLATGETDESRARSEPAPPNDTEIRDLLPRSEWVNRHTGERTTITGFAARIERVPDPAGDFRDDPQLVVHHTVNAPPGFKEGYGDDAVSFIEHWRPADHVPSDDDCDEVTFTSEPFTGLHIGPCPNCGWSAFSRTSALSADSASPAVPEEET